KPESNARVTPIDVNRTSRVARPERSRRGCRAWRGKRGRASVPAADAIARGLTVLFAGRHADPGEPSMRPALYNFAILAIAVLLEVIGTTFLQRSEQFTRLFPTAMMAVCYAGAFY